MKKDNQILEIFRQNKGYARTRDIVGAGVHHHYLDMLVQEGKVVKIKRGLYRLASVSVDDELEEVSHIAPNGVVCLFPPGIITRSPRVSLQSIGFLEISLPRVNS